MRRTALFVSCVALWAAIGTFDWITGTQLRVFPLYFIPIVLIASRSSRRYALGAAFVSASVWSVTNSFIEQAATAPLYIDLINATTMFVAFSFVAWLFAELRASLRSERETSRTDALTELPNRRGFMERAGVLLAAGRRTARPMTLAYIDLDHFKKVNDAHGHAVGDRALRTAANVLRACTRFGDIVARLGGDEFAALFPDLQLEQATEVLERLRAAIATAMTEEGWPITASIGAITFDAAELDLSAAIGVADTTMYAVKQSGKNRVRVDAARKPATPVAAAGNLGQPST